jgi:hypothetical protein
MKDHKVANNAAPFWGGNTHTHIRKGSALRLSQTLYKSGLMGETAAFVGLPLGSPARTQGNSKEFKKALLPRGMF